MKKLKKEDKKKLVLKLTSDVKESYLSLLIGFSGLSVNDMQGLRSDLSELECKMMVVKNTLIEKTFENVGMGDACKELEGSVFLVWSKSKDEIGILKKLVRFKEKTDKIDFKTGILNNRVFDSKELTLIGKLPDRKQLEASLVMNIRMPLTRIINSLKYPTTRLINNLNQIAEIKKEK
ncbi:50S ribosomal protein L10 [bacterium]|nr:50S ribosomal protein L10 [bacterium]